MKTLVTVAVAAAAVGDEAYCCFQCMDSLNFGSHLNHDANGAEDWTCFCCVVVDDAVDVECDAEVGAGGEPYRLASGLD